jgi:hypothetical protein
MNNHLPHNYDGRCKCSDCIRFELNLGEMIKKENSYELKSLLTYNKALKQQP